MKKGKSPGTNGFTAEFFKHFWDVLGVFLFRAIQEGIQKQRSLISHREGVITLIPKQGKPKDSLKGWRPISLLNVDFKIISAAITNRLKTVMHDLISPAQTAYIPGRYIGENTRLMYDVIEYVNNTSSSGVIMAVDFEAAFDTVSWEFLTKALSFYNFGPYCMGMIKTFYLNSNNFSRILLDGYLGPKVNMERGIRQGDPASGYLFNLVMEPLTNQILQAKHIQGIPIHSNIEVRLSQYADDLIIFSRAELSPIKAIFDELLEFTNASGLHINIDKTKCLQIGQPIDITFLDDLGVNVVNELKVLGILYNSSNQNIVNKNISQIMPKISHEIAQWKRRYLTLIGKITVVKAMLISKLVHIFSALPNPSDDEIKNINSILFKYVWNSGPDKIKRTRVVQNYEHGGLKMIEIRSFIKSLKVSWLKRLYWAESNVIWADSIKRELPPIDELICFGSSKLRDIAKNGIHNRFWGDVVIAWADVCANFRVTSTEVFTEKMWFSNRTKFKMGIVRDWDKKGLRFIADLYCKDSGTPLSCSALCSLFKINMTFLCHSSLFRSIAPHTDNLKSICKTTYPIMPYKIALLARKTNLSRTAYLEFIASLPEVKRNPQNESNLERKWLRDIGYVHEGTLRDVRLSTNSTYIQTFHYRVVSRIICTNTFLYRIAKSENSLCTFCNASDETLVHLFWGCAQVKKYLEEIMKYLKDNYSVSINFNIQSWFFPRVAEESKLNILIITIAKVGIYKAKYKERPPNIKQFLSLLKLEAEKEPRSAHRKATDSFLHKWGNVSKILSDSNSRMTA